MKNYTVIFFEENGENPVKEFLKDLQVKVRIKLEVDINFLGDKEPNVLSKSKHYSKMTNTELWEIKRKYEKNAYRIFYFYHGKYIILLHGFIKKTDKTPKGHIKIAEKRMGEFLKNEGV